MEIMNLMNRSGEVSSKLFECGGCAPLWGLNCEVERRGRSEALHFQKLGTDGMLLSTVRG